MNLKKAFQYQSKLASLIEEVTDHFAMAYFIKKTKTTQKSELNKLIDGATFEDEVIDESYSEYGKYSIINLMKCLNLLWTERCQLATGISLAKNTLSLTSDEVSKYCYDAMLTYNNDRRSFLNRVNLDILCKNMGKPIIAKDNITYMGNVVSYPVTIESEVDLEQINFLKQVKKEIAYSADILSSDLESSLYKIEIEKDYIPVIPYSITFDDLYSEIDTIITEKNKRIGNIQKQSEENITISAKDLENELN